MNKMTEIFLTLAALWGYYTGKASFTELLLVLILMALWNINKKIKCEN